MNDIKFYNICPAGIESGGPELAHQMCNTLVRLGHNARMYYNQSNKLEPCDVSACARYLKYNTEHAKSMSEVEDGSSILSAAITHTSPRDGSKTSGRSAPAPAPRYPAAARYPQNATETTSRHPAAVARRQTAGCYAIL